jgi:cytochrome b6-f complex iron-sulfur subunit
VALVSAGSAGFLVARTGQTTFSAVTAVCTHEGCTVSQFTGSVYQCPCHGSQFTTSGAVVRGPAAAALSSRPTAFSNNVLTITV